MTPAHMLACRVFAALMGGEDGQTQAELAAAVGTNTGSVSRAVRLLLDDNLVYTSGRGVRHDPLHYHITLRGRDMAHWARGQPAPPA
jgi:predicted transcriptional regulator